MRENEGVQKAGGGRTCRLCRDEPRVTGLTPGVVETTPGVGEAGPAAGLVAGAGGASATSTCSEGMAGGPGAGEVAGGADITPASTSGVAPGPGARGAPPAAGPGDNAAGDEGGACGACCRGVGGAGRRQLGRNTYGVLVLRLGRRGGELVGPGRGVAEELGLGPTPHSRSASLHHSGGPCGVLDARGRTAPSLAGRAPGGASGGGAGGVGSRRTLACRPFGGVSGAGGLGLRGTGEMWGAPALGGGPGGRGVGAAGGTLGVAAVAWAGASPERAPGLGRADGRVLDARAGVGRGAADAALELELELELELGPAKTVSRLWADKGKAAGGTGTG